MLYWFEKVEDWILALDGQKTGEFFSHKDGLEVFLTSKGKYVLADYKSTLQVELYKKYKTTLKEISPLSNYSIFTQLLNLSQIQSVLEFGDFYIWKEQKQDRHGRFLFPLDIVLQVQSSVNLTSCLVSPNQEERIYGKLWYQQDKILNNKEIYLQSFIDWQKEALNQQFNYILAKEFLLNKINTLEPNNKKGNMRELQEIEEKLQSNNEFVAYRSYYPFFSWLYK